MSALLTRAASYNKCNFTPSPVRAPAPLDLACAKPRFDTNPVPRQQLETRSLHVVACCCPCSSGSDLSLRLQNVVVIETPPWCDSIINCSFVPSIPATFQFTAAVYKLRTSDLTSVNKYKRPGAEPGSITSTSGAANRKSRIESWSQTSTKRTQ